MSIVPVALVAASLALATPSLAAPSKSAPPDTAFVRIGSGAAATGAFVAYPPGGGSGPGIVLAHEWWGLNKQIRGLARRLARDGGYVVIVPDLYHGKVADDPEQAHVLSRALEMPAADAVLAAATTQLRGDPRVKGRLGVMGLCMGGSIALDYAMHEPGLAAVVMFYGGPDEDPAHLAKLTAPVLAHFGAEDDGIPAERVARFQAAMKQAGRSLQVYTYAGAGHAFMNDSRPSYRPDAARQAWARTLDFLQRRLRN